MIKIVRNHQVTKELAISKIDNFINDLISKSFSNDVKIIEPRKQWNGDVMLFSFKVKKGFFSATIEGIVIVNDTDVILTSELPGMVKALISEEKIKDTINAQFNLLF
ncbi:MAG TPA: polyhydroxyalkanoic acid system family protein [Candidatus Kapabacteria bacterium]|nr:polyhydroxyalkanoic acid system family protein [Candidatus Kapabacteria bacterium]